MSPVNVESLDKAIDVIKKRRGLNAIRYGSDQPSLSRIPVESPAIMRITSGGIPMGRVTRFWGGSSTGKAISLDTPIPTFDGWKTMGDIEVGDRVFEENGFSCKVLNVSDVMYNHKVYEVEFSDGEIIKADGGHLWFTSTNASRKSDKRATGGGMGGKGRKKWQKSQRVNFHSAKTTEEILNTLKGKSGENNHAIRISKPIWIPAISLPLDPYLMGYWLGDGDSNMAKLTVHKDDVQNVIDNLEDCHENYRISINNRHPSVVSVSFGHLKTCIRGHKLVKYKLCQPCEEIRKFCRGSSLNVKKEYPATHFSTTTILKNLNVIKNKHIPQQFLRASINQRWELLQGLMDSDGTADKIGHCSFSSSNKILMNDFYELICSLGMKGKVLDKITSYEGKKFNTQTIHFSTTKCPFKLKRKVDRWRSCKKGTKNRYIVDIRRIESEPVKCIEVDSRSHLYLCGKGFIPTHNSLLALSVVKAAQNLITIKYLKGLKTCWWDVEKQFEKNFAEHLGVDTSDLLIQETDIIEDIANEMPTLMKAIHVHVIDSCSEGKPADRLLKDAGDWDVGLKVRVWEKAWEYIMNALDKEENCVIAIDHASRDFKTKSEKPLGGKEIEHHSSLSIQFKKTKWLYYDDEGLLQTEDKLKEKGILGIGGQKEADGQEIVVQVAKSRICRPLRKGNMRLDLHTFQFDTMFELMDGALYFDKQGGIAHRSGLPAIANVTSKQGGWHTLPDGSKIQGERALRLRIEEDKELQNVIRKAMLSGN